MLNLDSSTIRRPFRVGCSHILSFFVAPGILGMFYNGQWIYSLSVTVCIEQ